MTLTRLGLTQLRITVLISQQHIVPIFYFAAGCAYAASVLLSPKVSVKNGGL